LPLKKNEKCKFVGKQLKFMKNKSSKVDNILFSQNSNYSMFFKIINRDTRIPTIGDKFSSRHGQKGICGLIVNQEDL